jgi:hypothetical protein
MRQVVRACFQLRGANGVSRSLTPRDRTKNIDQSVVFVLRQPRIHSVFV